VRFRPFATTGVLLAAALLSGGHTAKPVAAGRITGTVVHATTGQPLAGINVSISPTEQGDLSVETTTGTDGRFAFENVARGKFSLSAHSRGFSEQAYQQHAPFSTAIAVGPGLASENLLFQLVPDASISGSVMDEENESVRNGDVLLFARDSATGKMELRARDTLEDQGRYHFGHLPPGTYYVAVSAQPWYATDPPTLQNSPEVSIDGHAVFHQSAVPAITTSGDSSLDLTYRITFYADAVDGENATPIQLHPGERATADITLRAVPAVHLTVRNASTDPNLPGSAIVQQRVFDRTLVPVLARSQAGAPGILKLSGIPPGHLVVNLRSFSGKQWKNQVRELDGAADSEIDAAESSSAAVLIQGSLQPLEKISLSAGAYIHFFNRETNETFGAPVSAKGKFEVSQNISGATDYEVGVINMGDSIVHRITATGAKMVGRTLVLPRSGTVQLTVIMSEGSARIDGTVLRDGKGVSQTMVLLVPEALQGNADLVRRDQSDSDGTFSLYQVLPGRYTVIAIADGWELDWQNPSVLRPYLEGGRSIEVTGARTYKISVPVQDRNGAAPAETRAEN
jgi:5-hydroxyisourate hydrolase-like protein (transthyretin family)